jgi:hypothetical protein
MGWIDTAGSRRCCGDWQARYVCSDCGMLSPCIDCEGWQGRGSVHNCSLAWDVFDNELSRLMNVVSATQSALDEVRSTVGFKEDGDALVAFWNSRHDVRLFVSRSVCNWEV